MFLKKKKLDIRFYCCVGKFDQENLLLGGKKPDLKRAMSALAFVKEMDVISTRRAETSAPRPPPKTQELGSKKKHTANKTVQAWNPRAARNRAVLNKARRFQRPTPIYITFIYILDRSISQRLNFQCLLPCHIIFLQARFPIIKLFKVNCHSNAL